MIHRRCAALAALLGAASLAPPEAHAFCRSTTCAGDCPVDADGCKTSGIPLRWAGMCVGISVQKDASRHIPITVARPAIVAAFTEWSRRPCSEGQASLAFMEASDVACRKAEYVDGGPNANVVMFQDDKWSYGGSDNTLGITTVTFDAETGEILDADLEINHALNELTVSDEHVVYDLQSIVTHEAGHLLGLDHSTATATIMHADYVPASIDHRALEADDVSAVCAAYPPDRQARCSAEPEGGFSYYCVHPDSSAGCSLGPLLRTPPRWIALVAALVSLVALVARRRGPSPDHGGLTARGARHTSRRTSTRAHLHCRA